MDAKTYLKELKRLTNSCNVDCNDCRLYDKMSGECHEDNESIGVDIVEKWAKDCPLETVLDVFKKTFPNYKPYIQILYPFICPFELDDRYEDKCKKATHYASHCKECWNQPAIVEPQKEPQKEPRIIESGCFICRHAGKNPDEWPCKVCSNSYTNEFKRQEVE